MIQIVTDSTSDITPAQAAQREGLRVVPMKTLFGQREYLDGVELTAADFYDKLAASDELPHTSQPTPHQFEQVFREILAAGDQALCLTISAKLSGTRQSAEIARDACGGAGVAVVDSDTTILGLRLLVDRALQLREEGLTLDELAGVIARERERVRIFALVDTLEYLQKGGRLSKTVAFTGALLGIKPIVGLVGGQIQLFGKARGRQRGFAAVFDQIDKDGGIDLSRPVWLGYTGAREPFLPFAELARGMLPGVRLGESPVGSTVGAHVGPGAAAIAYFRK
ncbi:MAG: DegV family protein [Christensenellales bacterium]|jgi:DegV family protein with EDD domain